MGCGSSGQLPPLNEPAPLDTHPTISSHPTSPAPPEPARAAPPPAKTPASSGHFPQPFAPPASLGAPTLRFSDGTVDMPHDSTIKLEWCAPQEDSLGITEPYIGLYEHEETDPNNCLSYEYVTGNTESSGVLEFTAEMKPSTRYDLHFINRNNQFVGDVLTFRANTPDPSTRAAPSVAPAAQTPAEIPKPRPDERHTTATTGGIQHFSGADAAAMMELQAAASPGSVTTTRQYTGEDANALLAQLQAGGDPTSLIKQLNGQSADSQFLSQQGADLMADALAGKDARMAEYMAIEQAKNAKLAEAELLRCAAECNKRDKTQPIQIVAIDTEMTPLMEALLTRKDKPDAPVSSAAFREGMLERHNQLRAQHGIEPMEWDEKLAVQATAWAEEMARQGTHVHGGHSGAAQSIASSRSFFDTGEGVTDGWYAERDYFDYDRQAVFEGLRMSVGHFQLAMNPFHTKIGAGQAVDVESRVSYSVAHYTPVGAPGRIPPPLVGIPSQKPVAQATPKVMSVIDPDSEQFQSVLANITQMNQNVS